MNTTVTTNASKPTPSPITTPVVAMPTAKRPRGEYDTMRVTMRVVTACVAAGRAPCLDNVLHMAAEGCAYLVMNATGAVSIEICWGGADPVAAAATRVGVDCAAAKAAWTAYPMAVC